MTAPALSKAFTGKTAGEWQYRVRACNGTQCSTPSDTLTVPVPGVTPAKPATPTADDAEHGGELHGALGRGDPCDPV